MAGLFYNLGKKVAPKIRKGKWIFQSLLGSRADAIDAEYQVGCDIALEIRTQSKQQIPAEDAALVRSIGSRKNIDNSQVLGKIAATG